jgi:pimeloyl-ACP methyl ester carboxylesterase
MELLHFDDTGPHAAPTLLVMLPGAYSTPDEFVHEGFVDALRRRRVPVDVVIAGARVDHYIEGKVLDRLNDEVVAPALARGVRQVWLLGISLGGLFALAYAARHPGRVTGVLTLAPYLGRRTLLTEVVQAGGPVAWAAGRSPKADDLLEHEVWAWIGRHHAGPQLHLGYGLDDRFADAHRLLATQLPAGQVFGTPGGHDWPVWRLLWQQWLARGLLPAPAATAA